MFAPVIIPPKQKVSNSSAQLQKPASAIIITAYMDNTHGEKKYEADKIALLGLFVVGLLIAHFISSSRYTGPLKAGAEVVAEIKRRGISSFLDNLGRRSFFLIKNARGRSIGFTMDVFTDSLPEADLNIQSAGFLYIRGRYSRQQVMSFQSDNSFDEFSWRSETAGPRARSGTHVLLGEDGVLTATKLARNGEKQSYKPDPASIPDFLLDLVFTQMLETGHAKIIVVTINAGGAMVEVVVSRIKNKESAPGRAEAVYELKVDFLDNRRISQRLYLDSHGRISKMLLEHDGIYLFERTSVENILKQFPEQADLISQKYKMLEQNLPQY